MKKFITLMILSALCLGAKAQQINGDFSTWEGCYPWVGSSSNNGRVTEQVGSQPKGWHASNVWGYGTGTGKNPNFVVQNGNSAVISNVFVGFGSIGAWAEGYLSLATPWNTAIASLKGSKSETDGGTFGGINFLYRPDAISFCYNWSRYDGKASFVGYLWKGTWTQNDVPANVVLRVSGTSDRRTKVNMTDRDANILSKGTSQGGVVTKSDDAVLIASYEEYLTESSSGTKIIEFDYKDKNATPEKINIIFASNDYFSQTVAGKTSGAKVDDICNSLTISDVKLIYYHSLTSCTYDGQEVTFDDNNSASVSALYDESKQLAYEKKGVGATVKKAYNNATGKLTITVEGNDYKVDNNSVTTYTIQFYNASATLAVNSAAQYGTFCAPFDVTIPAGVQAYTIGGIAENGKLTLVEQQNTIPAHIPVIVYSESASGINEVQFGVATSGTATSNYLTGVYTDTKAPVGSYVLQNQRGRVGFYQVQAGIQPWVRANRAYLTVPASANVKAFYMDDATAIQTVEELLSGKAEIYDLAGRRQQKLQKGINIVGGKKVLVK